MKVKLKQMVTRLLRRSVRIGEMQILGDITISQNGYYGWTPTTLPSDSTLLGWKVSYGTNTGAFWIPPYMGATQYIVGTPNAKATSVRVWPIYYLN